MNKPFEIVSAAASFAFAVLVCGCTSTPKPAEPAKPEKTVPAAIAEDQRTFEEVFPMKPAPRETEYVTMSNACGTAKVSLIGAHVVSYRPAGGDEVLFCPTSMPYASGMKLHGGIPICWPWFGNFGAPASQAHAFARYALFTVVSHERTPDVSVLTLRLDSSDETKQWFPHDFRLTLVITLGRRLDLELITENTGKTSFAVTEGFHTYLAVDDSARTVVKGLWGSRLDLMDPAKENPAFKGGDWMLTHFGSDVLITPVREWLVYDGDRIIGVAARGTKRLILYNPGPPAPWNPENLAPEDYKRFLCVEPVTIGRENAVRILPGRSHSIMTSLTCRRDRGEDR